MLQTCGGAAALLATAILLLVPMAGCVKDDSKATPAAAAPAAPTETAPKPEHFDLTSKITGVTYRIFVSKPTSAAPAPKVGWPIFYVADGNMFFETAAQAAWINVSGGAKPALVVGIGYPSEDMQQAELLRNTDMLPALDPEMEKQIVAALPKGTPLGKGSEAFYRFIVEELQPRLAKQYAVDTADTTLWGHSLGGLFVVETLFRHPEAFRTFVASSPSIWVDDRKVLAGEAAFADAIRGGKAHPRVLISVGENEQRAYPKDLPLPAGLEGMSREDFDRENMKSRMVDNAAELAERLRKVEGATVEYRLYKDEGHLSVIPGSLSRAITFSLGGSHM